MTEGLYLFFVGVFFGFSVHQIILQLAYRLGIVEYKGLPK